MLLQPGTFTLPKRRSGDPILRLANMNHYSDPSLSEIKYHEGNAIKEIMPLAGVNIMQQLDPTRAMHFVSDAFGGLGGYGFPVNDRFMMYDVDPIPFQAERTVGIVFRLDSSLNNNLIFGYAKHNSFNTSWRVQTNTQAGGRINFGRDLNGGFPLLVPSFAASKEFIIIIRQKTIDQHEFFINSYENPIVINPRDDYYSSNRVRLMLGRYGTTRSETAAMIGPIFDAYSLATDAQIKKIAKYLCARTGIPLDQN
jgi:hypothetical protein